MKKNIYVGILVLVIAIFSISLIGCNKNNGNGGGNTPTPVDTFTVSDVYNLASFKTETQGTRNLTVSVRQGSDVVYRYVNGREQNPYNLEISALDFKGVGEGLTFDATYFANEKLEQVNGGYKYTADITNVESFIGDADASGASVEVDVSANKKLEEVALFYSLTKSGIVYTVEISVTLGE